MTLKRVGSVITMSEKGQGFQTSTSPTESGVLTPLSSQKKTQAVARLLEINDPHQVDKNLISSLESLTGYPVIEDAQVRYKSHGAEIIVRGYQIKCDTEAQLDKAIEAVQASLTPMPIDDIKKQLIILSTLVVKPSGESSGDMSVRINAISNQLMEYPADIVNTAIQNVSRETTFWPAYAEFYKHIGWKLRKRIKLLEALTAKKLAFLQQKQ
jgi:hypothetical protein